MSAGTPRLNADQVIAILKRNGFSLAGQSGSHQKWRKIPAVEWTR